MMNDVRPRKVIERSRRMRGARRHRRLYWLPSVLSLVLFAGLWLLVLDEGAEGMTRREPRAVRFEFAPQVTFWDARAGYVLQARPEFLQLGRARSDLLASTFDRLVSAERKPEAPEYTPPLPPPPGIGQLPLPGVAMSDLVRREEVAEESVSVPAVVMSPQVRVSEALLAAGFGVGLPPELPSNAVGRVVLDVALNARGEPEFWIVLEGKGPAVRAAEGLLRRGQGSRRASGRVVFDFSL